MSRKTGTAPSPTATARIHDAKSRIHDADPAVVSAIGRATFDSLIVAGALHPKQSLAGRKRGRKPPLVQAAAVSIAAAHKDAADADVGDDGDGDEDGDGDGDGDDGFGPFLIEVVCDRPNEYTIVETSDKLACIRRKLESMRGVDSQVVMAIPPGMDMGERSGVFSSIDRAIRRAHRYGSCAGADDVGVMKRIEREVIGNRAAMGLELLRSALVRYYSKVPPQGAVFFVGLTTSFRVFFWAIAPPAGTPVTRFCLRFTDKRAGVKALRPPFLGGGGEGGEGGET